MSGGCSHFESEIPAVGDSIRGARFAPWPRTGDHLPVRQVPKLQGPRIYALDGAAGAVTLAGQAPTRNRAGDVAGAL